MRCPKCGYISFDHLDSCRKCHKPIAQTEFKGTTYPVIVPTFLQQSQEIHDSGFDEEMVEVLDPDLDLLADENSENAVADDFEIAFGADQKEDDLSLDEDDLSIDTSRFADVPINMQVVQETQPVETQPVQFEMPEGLADISDLARPVAEAEPESESEISFGDDDLRLDDLDLSFGGDKGSGAGVFADDKEFDLLSLDDIDLSGGLEGVSSKAPSRPVDDDLDFNLDLGTLGEGSGKSQKKVSDDLPEFTLSLE